MYLALPTPASIRAMEIWLAQSPKALTENLTISDQGKLHGLERKFPLVPPREAVPGAEAAGEGQGMGGSITELFSFFDMNR